GQDLTDAALASLMQRGRESVFLTKALRSAMERSEYQLPLAALLRKLIGTWSGGRPEAGLPSTGRAAGEELANEPGEVKAAVTLALLPSEEVPNGWNVCWSFPATVDVPRCSFEIAGQRMTARLHRASAIFLTDASPHHVRQSLAALSD